MKRPASTETAPYYFTYIDKVETDDFLSKLKLAKPETLDYLHALPPEKWDFSYGPGKWTIKEVFLHIIDTERIFAYRALRIGRNDSTPIPGYDQDEYMAALDSNARSTDSVITEYLAVRDATVALFENFDEKMLSQMGIASENPVSARALGFVIAGHEEHHMRILRERYVSPQSR